MRAVIKMINHHNIGRRKFFRLSSAILAGLLTIGSLGNKNARAQEYALDAQQYTPQYVLQNSSNPNNYVGLPTDELLRQGERLEDVVMFESQGQKVLAKISSEDETSPYKFYLYKENTETTDWRRKYRADNREDLTGKIQDLIGGIEPLKVKVINLGQNGIKAIVWDSNTNIHQIGIKEDSLIYERKITESLENKLGFYPTDLVDNGNEIYVKGTKGIYQKYEKETSRPKEPSKLENMFENMSLSLSPILSVFSDGNSLYALRAIIHSIQYLTQI